METKCRSKFDKGIAEANPEDRVALLQEMSKNEQHPSNDEERFFNALKGATAFAYYSSNIGIHKEMEYKGNLYLPQFVGTELK